MFTRQCTADRCVLSMCVDGKYWGVTRAFLPSLIPNCSLRILRVSYIFCGTSEDPNPARPPPPPSPLLVVCQGIFTPPPFSHPYPLPSWVFPRLTRPRQLTPTPSSDRYSCPLPLGRNCHSQPGIFFGRPLQHRRPHPAPKAQLALWLQLTSFSFRNVRQPPYALSLPVGNLMCIYHWWFVQGPPSSHRPYPCPSLGGRARM